MSDSNTATPLQQEVQQQIIKHTERGSPTAAWKLTGVDNAVVVAWFAIATDGKRPTITAICNKTGLPEKAVTACMANPKIQEIMERTGHGVIDIVQLAVALRVAEKLEEYTRKWFADEMEFGDIPKPMQELAMEAYKCKIPETRAKQETAKVEKTKGRDPMPISAEALKLLE